GDVVVGPVVAEPAVTGHLAVVVDGDQALGRGAGAQPLAQPGGARPRLQTGEHLGRHQVGVGVPPGADVDRHDRVDVVDGRGPQGPAHDRLRMCDEPPTCMVSGSMRVLRLCQRARWTLPALRQLVQTLSFFLVPPTIARTVWMLGFQRRFVRRWECEMLWPKLGDLAHTSHVEATGVSSVVRAAGAAGSGWK